MAAAGADEGGGVVEDRVEIGVVGWLSLWVGLAGGVREGLLLLPARKGSPACWLGEEVLEGCSCGRGPWKPVEGLHLRFFWEDFRSIRIEHGVLVDWSRNTRRVSILGRRDPLKFPVDQKATKSPDPNELSIARSCSKVKLESELSMVVVRRSIGKSLGYDATSC